MSREKSQKHTVLQGQWQSAGECSVRSSPLQSRADGGSTHRSGLVNSRAIGAREHHLIIEKREATLLQRLGKQRGKQGALLYSQLQK